MSAGNVTANITCDQALSVVQLVTNTLQPQPNYSLASRCAAEFTGVMILVFIGDAVLGYGPSAMGYGFAYFSVYLMLNYITWYFNPALVIADWVLGNIGVGDFFALCGAELAGAIVGAFLVWLLYLVHFFTVPEPPPESAADNLLRTRDFLGPNAEAYVGNKVWVQEAHEDTPLGDVPYYLAWNKEYHLPKNALLEKVLGKDALVPGPAPTPPSMTWRTRLSMFREPLWRRASGVPEEADKGGADVESQQPAPQAGANGSTTAQGLRPSSTSMGNTASEPVTPTAAHLHPPAPGEHEAQPKLTRRFSITVADLHTRLLHLDDEMRSLRTASMSPIQKNNSAPEPPGKPPVNGATVHHADTHSSTDPHSSSAEHGDARHIGHASGVPTVRDDPASAGHQAGSHESSKSGKSTNRHGSSMHSRSRKSRSDEEHHNPVVEGMQHALHATKVAMKKTRILPSKVDALLSAQHQAALLADKAAKLHVFSTRPSINAPVWNFVCEFLNTTTLVFLVYMIRMRRAGILQSALSLWPTQEALVLGFTFFLLIVALGGPTGFAGNPARDLGPRIAHWILPIPNKGPSEWSYAWIPVVAPLCGGLAGAGLYAALRLLYHGQINMQELVAVLFNQG